MADVTNDPHMNDGVLKIFPYEKYWSFVDLQRWLQKNHKVMDRRPPQPPRTHVHTCRHRRHPDPVRLM